LDEQTSDDGKRERERERERINNFVCTLAKSNDFNGEEEDRKVERICSTFNLKAHKVRKREIIFCI
jgi:hypothetical protein